LRDPSFTCLYHVPFGATPKPVFDEYQRWQLELERQPVEFSGRRFAGLMAESRAVGIITVIDGAQWRKRES
jgi:isopenicillin-N epimerase